MSNDINKEQEKQLDHFLSEFSPKAPEASPFEKQKILGLLMKEEEKHQSSFSLSSFLRWFMPAMVTAMLMVVVWQGFKPQAVVPKVADAEIEQYLEETLFASFDEGDDSEFQDEGWMSMTERLISSGS